jgi:hypothetical protein
MSECEGTTGYDGDRDTDEKKVFPSHGELPCP